MCLVGGMRGISLQEVVRTVHMKLDLARLQNRIEDVLITDLAKFFDVIAQDIHPIVGARVGLGEADHLATHTEGFSYTLPLGPWQSHTQTQLLGTPQGTVQGVHAGATAALPFLRYMDIAYRSSAVEPFRFPGLMWVDDTIVLLERGDSHPIQGSYRISGYTTRGSCGWTSLTARSSTAPRQTHGPYGRLRQQPWPAT